MALKAIIHRAGVSFSDLDNHVYTDHSLTIARHPSETEERMMIRILAYVLNAPQNGDLGYLELGKDLWEADEPALIQKDLTGFTEHWIDLGQPDEKRLVRVCGRCKKVSVYSYAATASEWWAGLAPRLARVGNLKVWQILPEHTEALGKLAARAMDLTITAQEGTLWVEAEGVSAEVVPVCLFGGE